MPGTTPAGLPGRPGHPPAASRCLSGPKPRPRWPSRPRWTSQSSPGTRPPAPSPSGSPYRLIPLAGPSPSGSTRPSRLCQRCFPPSPASPGSDCAQLLPNCCDSPARRSCTSFDSQRLTAHQRLVAHTDRRHMTGDHHGRPSAPQLCCSQPGTGFSARTASAWTTC
jgi:hypothetical protein